jgi:hypothetical protein
MIKPLNLKKFFNVEQCSLLAFIELWKLRIVNLFLTVRRAGTFRR